VPVWDLTREARAIHDSTFSPLHASSIAVVAPAQRAPMTTASYLRG
jgi:hypothetical protein